MPFVAVLDADVLYPQTLRSVLLFAAEHGLYQARWTDRILDEASRNVEAKYPGAGSSFTRVREAFDDALVTDYEALESAMTNNPKDRHVLAAAVACGAQLIVTRNIKDYPLESRRPYHIDIQTPDEFLLSLWDLDQEAMTAVLDDAASVTRNPALHIFDIVGRLRPHAPAFAAEILDRADREAR